MFSLDSPDCDEACCEGPLSACPRRVLLLVCGPTTLRLRQEGDFGALHRFDIPPHMGDQWGYVDGAFSLNHLLPMSKHAPDRREANLVRHSVQTLQLSRAAEAKVCAGMHNLGEPLGEKPQSRIMDGDYVVLATHRFV